MSRRRDRRWKHGEAFGTSLADILTTALGCVLLLFLVAVMNIRQALSTERAAHVRTQELLQAEESGRLVAEQQKQVVQGKKSALETALTDAQAAFAKSEEERGGLERALRAQDAEKKGLEQQLVATNATLEDVRERYGKLREAAANVVSRLDPGQLSPVDLMLVIDGTGSMEPSLDAVRRDLQSLVTSLGVVSSSARVGVVVFRDRRENKDFRIESHPLTADTASLRSFLGGIRAASTHADDDLPEWMLGGLQEAARASYRDEAVKLMVVVSDAAAQDDEVGACEAVATRFRESGGRVFVVSTIPSGYDRKPEMARDYDQRVLPEHAAIAAAGGGIHITGTGSDTLVHEALRATLHTRVATPIDELRGVLETEPAMPD